MQSCENSINAWNNQPWEEEGIFACPTSSTQLYDDSRSHFYGHNQIPEVFRNYNTNIQQSNYTLTELESRPSCSMNVQSKFETSNNNPKPTKTLVNRYTIGIDNDL